MEWKTGYANGKQFTYRKISDTEWEFRSNSGQKTYIVKMNSKETRNYERAGTLSCNCPSWIFNHGYGSTKNNPKKRWCSHCKLVMEQEINTGEQIDVVKHRIKTHKDVEWW